MARWTKFEKRMRECLIDGVEFKISKRYIRGHSHRVIIRFAVLYNGESIINYPQAEDCQNEGYSYWYGSTAVCAMFLVDSYFTLKHGISFTKSAHELYKDAYEIEIKRRNIMYHQHISDNTYFLKTFADDLLLILKICDRRTGKRSLRKIDIDTLKPVMRRILQERLQTKYTP